jgi:outer membrane lipoprotein-sorting protein
VKVLASDLDAVVISWAIAGLLGAVLCWVTVSSGAAGADDPAAAARAVLDRARELGRTTRKWNDRTQHLKLRIIDRRGGERLRELVIRVKKYPEERSRTIVFFQHPPDVKGVGMLQWADPKGRDEQWLYLPELRKSRQISGAAKRESFVGTDFSYEDLAIITQVLDWNDTEARASLLRDEERDGQPFHVIELVPTGKELSYARLRLWLHRDELVILRFEMLDGSGTPVKTLSLSDVRKVGAIPTPFQMEMRSEQSGSRTVVEFTEVTYDTGIGDEAFGQRALERGL